MFSRLIIMVATLRHLSPNKLTINLINTAPAHVAIPMANIYAVKGIQAQRPQGLWSGNSIYRQSVVSLIFLNCFLCFSSKNAIASDADLLLKPANLPRVRRCFDGSVLVVRRRLHAMRAMKAFCRIVRHTKGAIARLAMSNRRCPFPAMLL